jgi:hypothetical protein
LSDVFRKHKEAIS